MARTLGLRTVTVRDSLYGHNRTGANTVQDYRLAKTLISNFVVYRYLCQLPTNGPQMALEWRSTATLFFFLRPSIFVGEGGREGGAVCGRWTSERQASATNISI
jgi:hypothetical protein